MVIVLFAILSSVFAISASAQTVAQLDAELMNGLRELEARGEFTTLTTESYVGVSKVEIESDISEDRARDIGFNRAFGYLIREICDPEREKSKIRALVRGSRQIAYVRSDKFLWTRISMEKSKVDTDSTCRPPDRLF